MTRATRTISDTDGWIIERDDAPDATADLAAGDLLADGLDSVTEAELLALPEAEIGALSDAVGDMDGRNLGIAREVADRVHGDTFLVPDGDYDLVDAWRDLGTAAKQEWRDRTDDWTSPVPTYEAEVGVPSAVGIVAARLLDGWVAEMTLIEPDAGPHADHETVVAEAVEHFRISGEPVGFRGKMYDEPAWRFEGLGDHEGEEFAVAPLEPGEDTTLWVKDSFTDEWDNRRGVGHIRTWPDARTWKQRDEE